MVFWLPRSPLQLCISSFELACPLCQFECGLYTTSTSSSVSGLFYLLNSLYASSLQSMLVWTWNYYYDNLAGSYFYNFVDVEAYKAGRATGNFERCELLAETGKLLVTVDALCYVDVMWEQSQSPCYRVLSACDDGWNLSTTGAKTRGRCKILC